MIEIAPKTIIAQMVNFGILMFFVRKFLFKPIGGMLDKRSQMIKDSLTEVENDREEIAKLREEYQERMTQLDKENYQRMQEAIQKGQEAAKQAIADAEIKAQQLMVKAQENIEKEKKEAFQEIRTDVGNLAVEIASKVVGEGYNSKIQKKLIDGFIGKIDKLGG